MPDQLTLTKGGETIVVPADKAATLVDSGWQPESDTQRQERESQARVEERNSGIQGAARASIIGGLRGLSLGASDVALRGIGGEDYARTAREANDVHPYLTAGSQIAGAVLPSLVGDVEGLGALAEYTPAGITSNIGSKIAGLGEGGNVLARIGATAGAGAFEGAAQSAGGYISDVALGDRDLSAEGFLGAMGKGALYGGVAGGALSTASNGLIAARRLFPAAELTPEAATAARFGAQRAVADSVDTSAGLEAAGKQAVTQTDRETQQFIQDLERERAVALEQAAKARTAEESAIKKSSETLSDLAPGPTSDEPVVPPKSARELMASWREKYPQGAVEYDAANAASRRQRLSDWARDFEAKTPEDATIKAYFSEPQDPMRTLPGERAGLGDTPKAVQAVARQAAAEASHAAYLEATAQAANVSGSGAELMARATYAGRRAAARAMDDVYAAYAAGKPIVDIRAAATQKLTGHLRELAEARTDMIQSLAKTDAGDLMAKLQGTKAGLDAGKSLPSLGERILQGAPKSADPEEAVAAALGKSKDVNADIADIAPKITRYEAAKANLTEALGEKASPDAIAHAQAFRKAQEQAANANASATANVAENVDKTVAGAPAKKPLIGGLKDKAEKLAMLGETLHSVGLSTLGLHSLPVVGPILSMFLKAKLLAKIMGNHSGSISATAEGTIAAKAAETQNRIHAALGRIMNNTADRIQAHAADLSGAAALGFKLFDDGKKQPYSSKPAEGKIEDLYGARLAELTSAMQPGAIETAVKARVNTSDPTILNAIIAAETNRLQYLYNAAPKSTPATLPGQKPQLPSKAEMLKFGNVAAAAHDPSAIFERVAKGGTARPEEVDCVQNCYPQLYAQAQKQLVDMLSKSDAKFPYMRRVAIWTLTGIPMDSTMSPDHAAYLQSANKMPSLPTPPIPHPTLTSSISVGDRSLTRLDR